MFAYKAPWIFLLALWILGSTWWHVCKIKYLCMDKSDSALIAPKSFVYTLEDGNRFRLEIPGHFSFATSNPDFNSQALGRSLDTLAAYLKANPERAMVITGYYSSAEMNKTSFTNLGLARAEEIKQYLIQQGVPVGSIQTMGAAGNLQVTASGDSLYDGLGFAFIAIEKATTPPISTTTGALTQEEDLAASQKFKSVFEPVDLYFPKGRANYIKTEATKAFFTEAIQYLQENKAKKLLLTGHTDNSGPEQVNMQLSLDRANVVKVDLQKAGVHADQIEVQPKGETQPKADNSMVSGRQANRRVTVVVIQ